MSALPSELKKYPPESELLAYPITYNDDSPVMLFYYEGERRFSNRVRIAEIEGD